MADADNPQVLHPHAFPTTGWTLLKAVQDRKHPEHQPAMSRFAELYRTPVLAFMRARGLAEPIAEDLTQDFFVWLQEHHDWVAKADRDRGRFRTFLRMKLQSFIADQTSPSRIPRQQGFERQIASLDGLSLAGNSWLEPMAGETPEQAFDRAFARSIVRTALQGLRTICETENRWADYEIFEAAYPLDGSKSTSQEDLAKRHGRTRDEIRGILDRMKKRGRRLLLAELREDGAGEIGLEAEADDLLRILES